MSKLSTRTIERLRNVAARIPARRLDMSIWYMQHDEDVDLESLDAADARRLLECKAVACFAGWTCAFYPDPDQSLGSISTEAQQLLGLDDNQKGRLFHMHNWPHWYMERYQDAEDATARIEVLRARVEHFIATEGSK